MNTEFSKLRDFKNKNLRDLTLNELSDLDYILSYFIPKDIEIKIKSDDGSWHHDDYIQLQETAVENSEYLKYCLTSQTEINIASESMYKLGKDSNLYVDTTCGGDYDIYEPFSQSTFELIREEAIRNDGEYEVDD